MRYLLKKRDGIIPQKVIKNKMLPLIFWGILALWGSSLSFALCADQSDTFFSASDGFWEKWENGIQGHRWQILHKKWGKNNNGCVLENVKLEKDIVNGVLSPVVVLYAHGDNYKGDIKGLIKVHGAQAPYQQAPTGVRTGAGIFTSKYYASGSYSVKMKIGDEQSPDPKGMAPSIWFFVYQEHYCGKNNIDGTKLNPDDYQYQPQYKEGNNEDGWYSVVNHEIDWPELGHGGDLNHAMYTTYWSEVGAVDSKVFSIPTVNDGKYHVYRIEWFTTLKRLNDMEPVEKYAVTDADVGKRMNTLFIIKGDHPFQGQPVVKNSSNDYSVHMGEKLEYYIDDIKVGETTDYVPFIAGQLFIAAWLPNWAGPASWEESKITIAEVKMVPYHNSGDIYILPDLNDGGINPTGSDLETRN